MRYYFDFQEQHGVKMITFEQAQQLVGNDIPNDTDFFLELLDGCIKNRGEEWVKEHKDLLRAQWEYLGTM